MTKAATCLSLQDILGVSDSKIEKVHVAQWNGHVYIKSMTSLDRDRYEALVLKSKQNGNLKAWEGMRARVVASCLCDAKGERIFPESTNDWQKLNHKNSAVISELFEVCMRLSGMGAETEGESEETLSSPTG